MKKSVLLISTVCLVILILCVVWDTNEVLTEPVVTNEIKNEQHIGAVGAEEPPVEEAPVEEAPVEEAPAEEAPAEEAPAEEAPAEEAPAEEASAEEAPVEEAPAEEAPAEEAPAEEASAEEAPVEEAPAEEAPAEEASAEEAPVEEAPVEEAPAEEAPVEEAPVEEAPAEEPPAEEPEVQYTIERGVKTFHYATTTIPIAFGQPKLTDEEIQWLIDQENPKLAAERISTVADCLNYFRLAKFQHFHSDYQEDVWCTHLCGEQIVARRGGGCGGMCNAVAYLLRNDYPEMGFVLVTGHVTMYIKIESQYYIFDPACYLVNEDGDLSVRAYSDCFRGIKLCADNLLTIAESMIETGWTEFFFTYSADHDMLPQTKVGPEQENNWIFPEGSEVTNWTPDVSTVSYLTVSPDYSYDWRTNCWLSESLVTHLGDELILPGSYPGKF